MSSVGFAMLLLVFLPMRVASVSVDVTIAVLITFDSESAWGEGSSLARVVRRERRRVLVGLI